MSEPKSNSVESGLDGRALIYVVDDESMLLELASLILAPLGYTVETFRTAEAALEAFKAAKRPPALIITDYAMHNMTGLDLVEECRKMLPRQKTLLVSGTVGKNIFDDKQAKPDLFLAKPYQGEQLINAIKTLLPD